MDILSLGYIGGILLYVSRLAVFLFGASKARSSLRAGNREIGSASSLLVTVVVPARNEEHSIRRCVESLFASDTAFPFEVIVVNDRSEDSTGEILSELQRTYPALKVHNTVEDSEHSNLRGKTRALHQGIRQSTGDLILMTDADCSIAPRWVQTVGEAFLDQSVQLVAACSVIEGDTFFERLQGTEWVHNHTLAAAGLALGQVLGCFGNNLAIRRSFYEKIGGYEAIPFSVTEDLALMQAVDRHGGGIHYILHETAKVVTLPCVTIGEYIKQHHRWVNGGRTLGWKKHLFVTSIAALWVSVLLAILSGNVLLAALAVLIKVLGDTMIVVPTLRLLNMSPGLRRGTPLYLLCMSFIELLLPFLLLKRTVSWKGQIFR